VVLLLTPEGVFTFMGNHGFQQRGKRRPEITPKAIIYRPNFPLQATGVGKPALGKRTNGLNSPGINGSSLTV